MAIRTSSRFLLFFVFVAAGALLWMASRANEHEIEAEVAARVEPRLQEALAEHERTFAEQAETFEKQRAEREEALDERAAAIEEAIARVAEPVFYTATPAQVEAVLQRMGVAYTQGEDEDGDPTFTFNLATYEVTMFFYGCEIEGCTSLRLWSGFNLNEPLEAGHLNEWNRTKRFGTAYRNNSGTYCLDDDLIVRGGVTSGAIEQFILYYRDRLSEFAAHIGF